MTAALLALTLAATPASAPAPAPAPVALARKVQAFYERTQDLEAGFVQKYTYAVGGRSQTSRGTLRVKKPGKLRWDYAEPSKKTIVVNGSRLTQYEPEENQAYVDPHFDASAMSAAVTFLLGKGSLEKEFHLAAGGADELVLTPVKPDARVEKVVLTVGEAGEVTATQVVDGSGNVNDIAFEHLRRNPGLADGVFVLDLPKDVHFVKAPGGS
jgi:outer membrane lipoprotein carrier protein